MGNVVVGAACILGSMLFAGNVKGGLLVFAGCLAIQAVILETLRYRNHRVLQGELTKFLDFLGNYSVTSGDTAGVFRQIARYMEYPLGALLELCSAEAQTTGDMSMALLAMAERVEHPKVKELLRNIEISMRYSADFSVLVQSSRSSIRAYEHTRTQRQGLMREAVINMMILLAMAAVVLLAVDGLIEVSVWTLLFHTWPGYMALIMMGVILLLFLRQLRRVAE